LEDGSLILFFEYLLPNLQKKKYSLSALQTKTNAVYDNTLVYCGSRANYVRTLWRKMYTFLTIRNAVHDSSMCVLQH